MLDRQGALLTESLVSAGCNVNLDKTKDRPLPTTDPCL
jgi:hypothetical protein